MPIPSEMRVCVPQNQAPDPDIESGKLDKRECTVLPLQIDTI
jgi:hypothetical protein